MCGYPELRFLLFIFAGSVTSLPAVSTLRPDLILVRMDGEPSPILVAAMDMMEERKGEEVNRPGRPVVRPRGEVSSVNRKDSEPTEQFKDNNPTTKPLRRMISRAQNSKIKRRHQVRTRVRRKRKHENQTKKGDNVDSTKAAMVRPSRLRVSRNLNLRTRRKIKPLDRGRNYIKVKDPEETTPSLKLNFELENDVKEMNVSEELPVESSTEAETESPMQDPTTMVAEPTQPENDVKRVQLEELNSDIDQINEEALIENTEIALQPKIASH